MWHWSWNAEVFPQKKRRTKRWKKKIGKSQQNTPLNENIQKTRHLIPVLEIAPDSLDILFNDIFFSYVWYAKKILTPFFNEWILIDLLHFQSSVGGRKLWIYNCIKRSVNQDFADSECLKLIYHQNFPTT